jgi:hypothetical protein
LLIQPYIPAVGYKSLKMSTKQKILNAISTHPKLVTFGIGLAITMAIGTAIGMLDHSQIAFAASSSTGSGGSGTSGASGA